MQSALMEGGLPVFATGKGMNGEGSDMGPKELTAEEADKIIDAMAPVLGLDVAPEYRPGVVLNLQIAVRLARIAEGAELTDHDEAAPVFEA